MNTITKSDFLSMVKLHGLEVLTQEQIQKSTAVVESYLEKALTDELSDIEKSDGNMLVEELASFFCWQVLRDDFSKAIVYTRKAQVDWEEVERGEFGEIVKAKGGVYKPTAENKKLGRVGQKYGEISGPREPQWEIRRTKSGKEIRTELADIKRDPMTGMILNRGEKKGIDDKKYGEAKAEEAKFEHGKTYHHPDVFGSYKYNSEKDSFSHERTGRADIKMSKQDRDKMSDKETYSQKKHHDFKPGDVVMDNTLKEKHTVVHEPEGNPSKVYAKAKNGDVNEWHPDRLKKVEGKVKMDSQKKQDQRSAWYKPKSPSTHSLPTNKQLREAEGDNFEERKKSGISTAVKDKLFDMVDYSRKPLELGDIEETDWNPQLGEILDKLPEVKKEKIKTIADITVSSTTDPYVVVSGKDKYLVDPQGYDYPKYVAKIKGEANGGGGKIRF